MRSELILAGLAEIDAHGIADFSLRRVANGCGASCAAPYRHFKNKNEFILQIIQYINSRWELLQEQIEAIYAHNLPKLITELCLALIRFRLANPEFRAVLTIDHRFLDERQRTQLSRMTEKINTYAKQYFAPSGEAFTTKRCYQLQSLVYGAVLLCDNGTFARVEDAMLYAGECLKELF